MAQVKEGISWVLEARGPFKTLLLLIVCLKMQQWTKACHGCQVARLAGIPVSVVASASEAGARMEAKLQARACFSLNPQTGACPVPDAVAHLTHTCGTLLGMQLLRLAPSHSKPCFRKLP